MERTSPPAWVEGLLRNDAGVTGRLYAAHFPAVRQYVLGNSGTLSDAQDVFQEAILVLWMKVKEGQIQAVAEGDPGGYLFQVAKHKWLDVVRSAARKHMKVVHDQTRHAAVDEPVDDTEARLARLRKVYATLDGKCRQVLDLFYFERKDLATIARALSVEEDSIRTIKYRCMMKLRSCRKVINGGNHREA